MDVLIAARSPVILEMASTLHSAPGSLDSLFYKFSDPFVTTLVSKDRVMAHNTVGALYQADKYLHLI